MVSAMDRARRLYGARPAVVDDEGTFTWGAFVDRARRAASVLDGLGIGEGDRYAILSRNTFRNAELMHAGYWSGRIPVPVNVRLAGPEIRHILDDSDCKLLVGRRGADRARRRGRARPLARPHPSRRPGDAGRGRAAIRASSRRRGARRGARHRRGRYRRPALHRRHHGAVQGRAAEPPQRVLQRAAMRDRARRQDGRRLSPRRADVPLRRPARDRLHPAGRGAHVPARVLARIGAARDGAARRDRRVPRAHHDHHDPPGPRLREIRPRKAAPGLLRLLADGGGVDPPRDGGAARARRSSRATGSPRPRRS